jgi:hypothetical protein
MLRLNPTRLRRFLTCEYDWYCYAVLGIESRAARVGKGLDRGKAMHGLLEHAIKWYARTGVVFDFAGQDGYDAAEHVFQNLYDREGVSLSEEDSHSLLAAIRYHVPRLNLTQWEVLTINGRPAVEIELFAPIPGNPDVKLQAIIDVVFRHRVTGQIWLIDWKTTFNAIDTAELPPHLEHNYQLAIERMILAHHGIAVDVSAMVHLRSVAPQPPEITPSRKKVTRNKANLACDWDTYRQAIIDNGEDPNADDVQAVREHLLTSTFARWRTDITDGTGQFNMRVQVDATAHRMAQLAAGTTQPIRNLRDTNGKAFRGCEGCDYAKWCSAGMRTATGGHDLSLLGVEYKARKHSPLVNHDLSQAKPFDSADAYIRFAAERGQTLEPHQEFRP